MCLATSACGLGLPRAAFPAPTTHLARSVATPQAEGELPERLIGSVRFEHLDLKTAAYLDDESGRIYK